MNAWVYILLCAGGLYYVGSHRGADVMDRVGQHNAGLNVRAWTYTRRPVKLVWCTHFQTYTDMIAAERQIKGWSREKKEALIRGDWAALPKLARGRSRDHNPSTPTPLILSLSKDESGEGKAEKVILRQAQDEGVSVAKVPRQKLSSS